jgi:apolipoprotein N-acyltransferase
MPEEPREFPQLVPWLAGLLIVAAVVVTPWSIPLEHGIAAAAWVAPILLLLIGREFRARLGMPVVAAILIMSAWVAADGLLAGQQRPVFAVLFGLVQFIPYALDKWLSRRLPTALRTLTFPVALTAIDAMLARYSPMATWGSPAYSHVDELVLLQLVSVVGMAGLVFATAWTASVSVEVIAGLRAGNGLPRVTLAWAAAAACVVIFGSVRLATAPANGPMVRVAGITQNGGPPSPLLTQKAIATMTGTQRAAYRPQLEAGLARLDARTRREAAAGAQIVVCKARGCWKKIKPRC